MSLRRLATRIRLRSSLALILFSGLFLAPLQPTSWDSASEERSLRRALGVNPNDAMIHHAYAHLLEKHTWPAASRLSLPSSTVCTSSASYSPGDSSAPIPDTTQ